MAAHQLANEKQAIPAHQSEVLRTVTFNVMTRSSVLENNAIKVILSTEMVVLEPARLNLAGTAQELLPLVQLFAEMV